MAILRIGRLSKALRSQLNAKHLSTQTQPKADLSDKETKRGPSYINHIGKDPLVYRNVGQQLDLTVENFPNLEAIVSCHENKRLTFSSLVDHVDRLGAGFLRLGLKPGDAIGIWAPNFLHWYLSMLAASRTGLISVGINPAFQGPEVKYCLNKVGIKAIIAPETFKSQNYYSILETIIPELKNSEPGRIKSTEVPSLQSVIIDTNQNYPGTFKFDDILDIPNTSEVSSVKKNMHKIDPDSPCNIQFTSGTTGAPKAAVLSHYNFVNNSIHVGNRNEYKNERICCQVPLFHAYGVVISIMGGISHAATLVLPSAGYNPEASLQAIANEKCTVIHGTPTMYVDLIKKQKELNLEIGSAKYAITGGAACSPQLFEDIKNVLGLKKVKTVFGMTETSAVIFQSMQEETKDNVLHTVGHVQDHVEVKVIDANGNTVPFGTPGELCIRGYCNMLGYYGDEEKTKEIMSSDRWLKTGDQFILREDGYGMIVGRLKEMIIRGGENIFPKEIEDFLNAHPDVVETHVIGVPDERMGEELCAFIRVHEGSSLTTDTLKTYCKGKIAHFKIPKYVKIVDDFPKTTSGKIQKFKLKEIYDKGV